MCARATGNGPRSRHRAPSPSGAHTQTTSNGRLHSRSQSIARNELAGGEGSLGAGGEQLTRSLEWRICAPLDTKQICSPRECSRPLASQFAGSPLKCNCVRRRANASSFIDWRRRAAKRPDTNQHENGPRPTGPSAVWSARQGISEQIWFGPAHLIVFRSTTTPGVAHLFVRGASQFAAPSGRRRPTDGVGTPTWSAYWLPVAGPRLLAGACRPD